MPPSTVVAGCAVPLRESITRQWTIVRGPRATQHAPKYFRKPDSSTHSELLWTLKHPAFSEKVWTIALLPPPLLPLDLHPEKKRAPEL